MNITMKSPRNIHPGDTLLRADNGILCGHVVTEWRKLGDGWNDIALDDGTRVMLGDGQRVVVSA